MGAALNEPAPTPRTWVDRRTLVRGLQAVVALTVAALGWAAWRSLGDGGVDPRALLASVRPGWLLVGAGFALAEALFGGLRVHVLLRVLTDRLPLRTAITSEFVLMFCAGVTPAQAGATPSQIAVLVRAGARLADVLAAQLLVARCTVVVLLGSALGLLALRAGGMLVVGGALDGLLGVSLLVFGAGLLLLGLAALLPGLLSGGVRRIGAWLPLRDGKVDQTVHGVERMNEAFRLYARRGKGAWALAVLLTVALFATRYAVAWFVLLGLGLSTTPTTDVAVGPPFVQVLLVQALLNFALYLSPTPGGSGVAEVGSASLMAPWVRGPAELPYLVLWRLLTLFLNMLVGGVFVFRLLGVDLLERAARATAEAPDDEHPGAAT